MNAFIDVSNLPRDGVWVETRGQDLDYDKQEYDVRIRDGVERRCWPNAGVFMDLVSGGVIEFADVTHVRLAVERVGSERPARRVGDPHPAGNRAARRARR